MSRSTLWAPSCISVSSKEMLLMLHAPLSFSRRMLGGGRCWHKAFLPYTAPLTTLYLLEENDLWIWYILNMPTCTCTHRSTRGNTSGVNKQNTIEEWTKGNILPVSKKGDLGITKNNSGITLTAIAVKVYNAMLLNSIRPEIKKILEKIQNSFRRNHSTIS